MVEDCSAAPAAFEASVAAARVDAERRKKSRLDVDMVVANISHVSFQNRGIVLPQGLVGRRFSKKAVFNMVIAIGNNIDDACFVTHVDVCPSANQVDLVESRPMNVWVSVDGLLDHAFESCRGVIERSIQRQDCIARALKTNRFAGRAWN